MTNKKKTENKLDAIVEEEAIESKLRPVKMAEFTGQKPIIENLKVAMTAAKNRKESLEHLLFYGPPGLGKTTLAHVVANEMKVNLRVTSGPAIERSGDLASIITNLEEGAILFIDEIHRLNRVVEEMLYPTMEDYALDIVLGKGPSARTVRLDLPKFTLIGATTRIGLIGSPMRDRFGMVYRLDFYNGNELAEIIARSAKILKIEIDDSSAREIGKRSRGTPRIANRLLRRVRDFSQVRREGKISPEVIDEALLMLEVDLLGLDSSDRRILKAIIEKHDGGPVGVETIAASTHEDVETIQDVYEPFLMQIGFLKRTPRGRMATKRAYKHLGISYPTEQLHI